MEFKTGDNIVYEDTNLNFFKGEIVDIWTNDNEETTAFFVATDTGLSIHFNPKNLEWCRMDESVTGHQTHASGIIELG